MTTGKTILTAVLVVTLLVPSVAVAQDATVRSASLAIQQPDYVDGDVTEASQNGTRLYTAAGETLEIVPLNFNQSDIVDFGVRSAQASLTYDDTFDEYVLNAENGTGTYQVYWLVNEQVVDDNTTETQTVRYTALIRVSGGVDLVHRPAGDIEAVRDDAANWQELNATLHASGFVDGGPAAVERTLQEMMNWYQLRKSPLAALTGNFTAVGILLVTTIGGALWLLLWGGYHQRVVRYLYRKLNIHEAIESEEGSAKETIAELDQREKLQALQNMDWQDIFGDDHIAAAFREQFGETVGEGTIEYLAVTRPRNILRDRLQAMGHDGYVAVVEDRAATDGGSTTGHLIASARVEPPAAGLEDVDDHDIIDLAAASDDTLDALLADGVLDWDATPIRTFDLTTADYDPIEMETPLESMNLQDLIEELRADMRHFDSPGAYGEYMREFLQSVREHPFCDEHGRVDELRYAMEQFLQHAQLLDDRFDYPLMHWHAQAWERAVIDYDPEQEAADLVRGVREGSA